MTEYFLHIVSILIKRFWLFHSFDEPIFFTAPHSLSRRYCDETGTRRNGENIAYDFIEERTMKIIGTLVSMVSSVAIAVPLPYSK